MWSILDPVKISLKTPPGAKITVFDMFGNLEVSNIELDLTRFPLYFEWQGCGPEAAVQTLRETEISVDNPWGIGPVRLSSQSGKTGISITLFNKDGNAVKEGSVRISSEHLENGSAMTSYGPIEAWKSDEVFIPAAVKPGAPKRFEIKILVTGKKKLFTVKATIANTKIINVREGAWTPDTKIENLAEGEKPAGGCRQLPKWGRCIMAEHMEL